jgi:hypothetical protein
MMHAYLDHPERPMIEKLQSALPKLLETNILTNKSRTHRPDFHITNIQKIENRALREAYEKARREFVQRLGEGNENEVLLYSGHAEGGCDFICAKGHDPSYGPYDASVKGFGALGKGTYLTGNLDKAISYANSNDGAENSFIIQLVLLGNPAYSENKNEFRHSNHNAMVRQDRSDLNRIRNDGEDSLPEKGMENYDSIIGKPTNNPGGGLLNIAMNSDKFDSTEYLIRNKDQILPAYRVFFQASQRVEPNSAELPKSVAERAIQDIIVPALKKRNQSTGNINVLKKAERALKEAKTTEDVNSALNSIITGYKGRREISFTSEAKTVQKAREYLISNNKPDESGQPNDEANEWKNQFLPNF